MDGVSNTIKEFADDFDSLYNSWKYVVEQDEDGINIKSMSKDSNDEWIEEESISIPFSCARLLFKAVAKCIESGEFTEDF